ASRRAEPGGRARGRCVRSTPSLCSSASPSVGTRTVGTRTVGAATDVTASVSSSCVWAHPGGVRTRGHSLKETAMDAKPGDRSEPDTDTSVEDVLAAFNADEIVEDPTNT